MVTLHSLVTDSDYICRVNHKYLTYLFPYETREVFAVNLSFFRKLHEFEIIRITDLDRLDCHLRCRSDILYDASRYSEPRIAFYILRFFGLRIITQKSLHNVFLKDAPPDVLQLEYP